MATIQGIYIALFGRPADPTGLAFFNTATGNGANLTAIADLASTPEYQDRFEGKSTVEIIIDIYQSLYGRNPDQAGLTFFSDALASGRQTINTIAINILDGARNDDLVIVNNKLAAASLYTAALDQPDEVAAYSGSVAAELGRQFLLPITADAASIPDVAAVDAAVTQLGSYANSFTLTEGVDIGTSVTFNAPRGFTPGGTDQVNTLNDDDVLTGTGTNATLNLTFVNDADTGDTSIAPTLKNMTNVNVDVRLDSGGTLDLQDATGVANLKINGIDSGSFRVDNLQAALTTLVIEESHASDADLEIYDVDAALKGTADALAMTLSDAQLDDVYVREVPGSPDQGYETITLESTGATNQINTLHVEDLQTLVITGDEDLRLARVGPGTGERIAYNVGLAEVDGSLTTVDASGLEASFEINLGPEVIANLDGKSGTKVDFTLIGTKQDDIVRLLNGFDSKGDSIEGGDGADTLVVFNSVVNGTVADVEALDIRSRGAAITVDASLFTGLQSILFRNEGGANPTTLNKLTADLINNISIQHGITGSNHVLANAIIANLATQTANDTAKFTWAEQLDGENRLINADPRFNMFINADKIESITLVDNDTESNFVYLNPDAVSFQAYELSNTLTLQGGTAGTFLSLDVFDGGAGSLYHKDASGGAADGKFLQDAENFDGIRLSAMKIDASAYLGDVIVRVDTLRDSAGVALPGGGQAITMGVGNDTVIFDLINDTTAGLSISDTVKGGEGLDTLAIDGNAVKINLSASEWTNVSGFETIRLIGNNVADDNANIGNGTSDAYGRNAYNLTLTSDLIANNGSAVTGGHRIDVINDNDLTNEADGATNVDDNTGVTIDARTLNAQSNFSYNGEEGAFRTADRFIMSDANVNGLALIDGGFSAFNTGTANEDVLEVRNSAVVTVGDLSGLKNIGTIEFTNDQAASQTAVLQLDNATVEALVDSTHTAKIGEVETLTINAFDNPLIAGAFTVLNLDATQVTSSFLSLSINGDGGADIIKSGAGDDTIAGGLGSDTITGGAGADDFLLTDQIKVVGAVTTVEADTITDFTLAQNDQLGFSLADLGAHGDQYAAGKNLVRIDDAATDLAAGDSLALVTVSAAIDLGGVTGNVIVLNGDFANAAAVEAAIIDGGTHELKFNGQFDKGESFFVVYDDGTNSHVALVTATDDTANDAKIADATKIDTVDLVTLTGVSNAASLTDASFTNLFL